ncbi:GntR family transcriptional regulator [Kribbella sp. NPDC056951]|uniref:GntR family transcriptional regulator n=1 Tax=Kribbella sp. NPDC056951 TaxID=3345978 RepID=UPI003633605A
MRGAAPQQTPKLQPAPRLMLRESVYESLKRLLMDNDLEPGTRLSIDGLARDLQVSQTPVREALFRCEAEGLVVRRPNAGYHVAPQLSRDALVDLYDLRLLLEPTAAARAATNATNDHRHAMDDAIRAMTPAVPGDGYQAYREFAEEDAKLHGTIATAAGNPLIAETLDRLRAHTHSYRLYFRHGIAEVTTTEHQAIRDMIHRRDPAGAETAMRTHLENSRIRLLAAYDDR